MRRATAPSTTSAPLTGWRRGGTHGTTLRSLRKRCVPHLAIRTWYTLTTIYRKNKFAILPVGQEELASAAGAWAVMGDSSSDEDERPAARAAPTSFLSGPELLPSLIIDESEAAPVRRIARDWGLE